MKPVLVKVLLFWSFLIRKY